MDRYDAVIIGGGPAGSTAAALLAMSGWSVALVEAKSFPRRKVCGEYLSATNWPLLEELRVAQAFRDQAGPPVKCTAVFVGAASVTAALHREKGLGASWGQALSRERLDILLLEHAVRQGVDVRQPGRCIEIRPQLDGFACRVESLTTKQVSELAASAVIAAHGSWDIGHLSTERQPADPRPNDLLAFKAHFRDANLPDDLMPLLSFPDGYGGMVHCDQNRVSLSCCIRRRRLEQLERTPGQSAGETVLEHIQNTLPVLQPVLRGAAIDGPWLSTGPIQPGRRSCFRNGVFVVGNAAGEAHPVVAEGISMAMQSAWLLAKLLIPQRESVAAPTIRARLGSAYSAAWKQSFMPRIRLSSAVAEWAMRPRLVAATLPIMRAYPRLLTGAARLSGKRQTISLDRFTTRSLIRTENVL